jgi:hypothetical protein
LEGVIEVGEKTLGTMQNLGARAGVCVTAQSGLDQGGVGIMK